MRVLIAEEALQTGAGHWPGYIGGIASGLRQAGDQVDVLVHRNCVPEVMDRVEGTLIFSRNCWLDAASQGSLGGLRHNRVFQRELLGWLEKQDVPYDWICALTMRLQHLLAFARISRSRRIPQGTRFLLLFVQGFGQYGGPGMPSSFPNSGSNLLARFSFWWMAKPVRAGRVVLAAETKGMQAELHQFTGLPVSLFPHPVPPPPRISEAPARKPGLTLTCPGFARHEKGTDLLQEAVHLLLDDPPAEAFRIVLQWPEAFAMPDGSRLNPDARLLKDPRVQFRNENLSASAYEAMIDESDIILLPYRRSSYHNRVSRVAIEAASRGKPLVYMSGTWSQEVADLCGAGIPIEAETAEALLAAIRTAMANCRSLRTKAIANAGKVVSFHSVETFRERLTGGLPR